MRTFEKSGDNRNEHCIIGIRCLMKSIFRSFCFFFFHIKLSVFIDSIFLIFFSSNFISLSTFSIVVFYDSKSNEKKMFDFKGQRGKMLNQAPSITCRCLAFVVDRSTFLLMTFLFRRGFMCICHFVNRPRARPTIWHNNKKN